MLEFLIFVAVVLSLPAVVLGVLQLVAPGSPLHEGVLRRLSRFKLWQVMAVVVVLGLLFSMASVPSPIIPFSLIVLIALGLFMKAWRNEFVFLMGRQDEDFPGRHDKLLWVLLLVFYAPAGVWFFRSYRLIHWPESAQAPEPGLPPSGSAVPSST
jgi:hypothetical protein